VVRHWATRDAIDHEQPRWAPDSSTLIYYTRPATASDEGALWEVGALGGPPRRLVSAIGGGDISHDGRWIAVFQSAGQHVELVVAARDGSGKRCIMSLPPEYLYLSPRWSPDDRFIAFERDSSNGFDMHLEIVSVARDERREVARCDWLKGFSWFPDGSGLVYSSSRGSSVLYPPTFNLRTVAADGRRDCQLTFGDVSYMEPDISHSSKLVANRTRSQSDIWRFPVADHRQKTRRKQLESLVDQGPDAVASPDGVEVVYLSDNGGHGNLIRERMVPAYGSHLRAGSRCSDWCAHVVAGGNWIVFIITREGQQGSG
jgi:Tol biopolymer transport system component